MKGLLQNFWLKVIALLMGCLVWLHVATDKTYKQQINLPLAGIDLRDSLTLINQPPDSLVVEVSATGKQLMRRRWRERGVRIIATEYGVGRHVVDISPANTTLAGQVNNITLEDVVFPRSIELQIDHTGSTGVTIVPDIDATADEGYAIAGIYVRRPEKAILTGPASRLQGITALMTGHKELQALRNSVHVTLPILLPEPHGYEISPDSAVVEIEVVPVKTRIYENIPIVVYNAPPAGAVTTLPAQVTVELTGPPEDIDLLHRTALTVSVDYHAMTVDSMADIKVDCPSNFQVKTVSADSARIVTR